MAPSARSRQTLDVDAGQAFDASAPAGGVSSPSDIGTCRRAFSGLDVGGLPNPRPIFSFVASAFMAGLLEVVLQFLFGVPPALADGSHLLGGGCSMGVLVRTKVVRLSSAYIAHKCIVPPGALMGKACRIPLQLPYVRLPEMHF